LGPPRSIQQISGSTLTVTDNVTTQNDPNKNQLPEDGGTAI